MKAQISKVLSLPKDETYVIATVSDPSQLPYELFFKDAKSGGKILMYTIYKEVDLYRPSTGQVIIYATLDFRDVTPTPVPYIAVAGASTSAVACLCNCCSNAYKAISFPR